MKFINPIPVLLMVIMLTACNGSQDNEQVTIEDLKWLEGTWKGEVKGKTYIESWKGLSGQNLYGMGVLLKNGDTVATERISIGGNDQELNYTATVQNDSLPTKFKYKDHDASKIVFVNNTNDFPSTISYEQTGEGKLTITLEGQANSQIYRLEKQ